MPQPPIIRPMSLESLALPQLQAMPNGVPLYRLSGADKGVVRFDILFKGGYAVQSKPLLAMFANRMLREGAGELSAAEQAELIAALDAEWKAELASGSSNAEAMAKQRELSAIAQMMNVDVRFSADSVVAA